jgi:hypothetical protein
MSRSNGDPRAFSRNQGHAMRLGRKAESQALTELASHVPAFRPAMQKATKSHLPRDEKQVYNPSKP